MAQGERGTVLTIGYEGKTLDGVLSELSAQELTRIIDVRAVAESSVPGFSRDELAQALAGEGLDYVHLGSLGDFQPEPYTDYMETDDWAKAYSRLVEELDKPGRACILSKPAAVERCHRRFLQRQLVQDGFRVVHLTPAGPREAVTLDQGTS
ncbi:MAG: DUF488 domain-containing protein [Candidatus Thermoplasmatota archaeon]|nr:DUF488 domain-containing protein [Candidatus Thermoplasmatota archaeon]